MMDLRSLVDHDKPKSTEDHHSDTSEICELSIASKFDLETEYISVKRTPEQSLDTISSSSSLSLSSATSSQSSSPSSDSQSGYVMVSSPFHGKSSGHVSIDAHVPDTSTPSPDRKGRKARSPPPDALSLCPFPPTDHHGKCPRRSSSSQLTPLEESAASEPEPMTPRTQKFHDDMLSVLSLLPPNRYVSPAPSVSEGELEEMETREF